MIRLYVVTQALGTNKSLQGNVHDFRSRRRTDQTAGHLGLGAVERDRDLLFDHTSGTPVWEYIWKVCFVPFAE